MVVEVLDKGEFMTFMSYRLPAALDDAIKGATFEAMSRAAMRVTPDDIYNSLPMMFPMTHLLTMNGNTVPGLSCYPVTD